MAVIDVRTFSECLKRQTSFKVILPNDVDGSNNPHYKRPMKTLILLHGYCGFGEEWLWCGPVHEFACKYNLCIVFPNGENSFYLDGVATGRQYATYVGKELPDYVRRTFGLSTAREDLYVGGFSMGGFGAIHTALQFPDRFAGAIGLSSALLTYGLADFPREGTPVANYEYYELMFGDLKKAAENDSNPEVLVDKLQEAGEKIPDIYMACGTEDFLNEPNRKLHEFLKGKKLRHIYEEGPGVHNFEFWNPHLEAGIRWLLQEEDS